MKLMSRVHVSPRTREVLRRATIVVVGIVAISALMYLAIWLATGQQQIGLRAGGLTFCVLLMAAIALFTLGEVVQ